MIDTRNKTFLIDLICKGSNNYKVINREINSFFGVGKNRAVIAHFAPHIMYVQMTFSKRYFFMLSRVLRVLPQRPNVAKVVAFIYTTLTISNISLHTHVQTGLTATVVVS